jgi:hypothetical protein
MRLSHSGRAFHAVFATQAQEAFLEGHVLAFEYFSAVPGRVRYENVPRNIFRTPQSGRRSKLAVRLDHPVVATLMSRPGPGRRSCGSARIDAVRGRRHP